jgi:division protein CdvB (Snf7/Vps24/ESCRT-III family)
MRLTEYLQHLNPLNRLTKEMHHMNESLKKVKELVDDIHAKQGVVLDTLKSAKQQISDLQSKLGQVDPEDGLLIAGITSDLQGIDDQVTGAIATVAGTPPAEEPAASSTPE